MSTVAQPTDQATDLMQQLSLDTKTLASESNKKTAVYQFGGVDVHVQVPPYDKSLTPLLPSDAVDPSVCYVPNGYQAYYYGAYGSGHDWSDYTGLNSEVYGENGSLVYPQGYGYAYPYSPATSPAPGGDGQQLYGAQQYQYPTYFPPTTSSDVSANKSASVKAKPAESNNTVSSTAAMVKGSNGSASLKPNNTSSNWYGGYVGGYQDPRYSYDAYYAPMTWQDVSKYTDVQRSITGAKSNIPPSSRNQNYRSQPSSMTGYGATQGYYNRMYPSKLYGQYGNTGRYGYDSRTTGRGGWVNTTDNKYRSWGRGNNGYFYSNENNNLDGLNELNRGPRAKVVKKGDSEEVKEENVNVTKESVEEKTEVPSREEYNKEDFPVDYSNAMFFIIKSYSEDDVHKSIKYNVWASTPNGNKKLAAAYQEAQQKPGGCPIFLFFSVNASGQYVGLAEMTGPVDFNTSCEYWQQDKWTGSFPLKWHIVKDVPNSLVKHITLENNENKPVTNSRDTQEVKLEPGLKMVKIFKEHSSKTCILDDFSFYEVRQKTILEKKAKQTQTQKHVMNEEKMTTTDGKQESVGSNEVVEKKESSPSVDVKVVENGSVGVVEANGS